MRVVTAPTGTGPEPRAAPPESPPLSAGRGREGRQEPSPVCELSFPECLCAGFRFSI